MEQIMYCQNFEEAKTMALFREIEQEIPRSYTTTHLEKYLPPYTSNDIGFGVEGLQGVTSIIYG